MRALIHHEREIAERLIDGATAAELEQEWQDEGRIVRQLWHVLDHWADEGWWDYGSSIRGGWLTEEGRDALLRRTRGRHG